MDYVAPQLDKATEFDSRSKSLGSPTRTFVLFHLPANTQDSETMIRTASLLKQDPLQCCALDK